MRPQRSILANSAVIFICRITLAAAGIIAVPYMINYLGIAGYGSWEAIYSVAAFCLVMSQGVLGTTLVWRMSNAYGQNDVSYIRRLIRIGSGVPYSLLLSVLPIVWFLRRPIIRWLNFPEPLVDAARIIFPLIVGLMILNGFSEIMGAVNTAFQRAGETTLVQTAARIVFYVIAIICLGFGAGIWGMAVGFAFFVSFGFIGMFLTARRHCRGIHLIPVLAVRDEVRPLLRYASWLTVGTVTLAFRSHLVKILLSSLASAQWVGYFSMANMLALAVTETCSFFYTPIVSAVGATHSGGNWDEVKSIYTNMTILIALAVGIVGILILGFYDRILILWMGRAMPQLVPILFILVVGNALAVIMTGAGTAVCRGIGKVYIETRYVVISLLLNAILAVILIIWLGALGAVAAASLSWVLSSAYFLTLMHRRVDLPVRSTLFGLLGGAAAVITVILTRAALSFIAAPTTRLGALRDILVVGALAVAFYFAIMFINPVLRDIVRKSIYGLHKKDPSTAEL